MKNFKRFLSLALALLITFSYTPTVAWSSETGLSSDIAEESGADLLADGDSTVAQIGETKYQALQSAIDEANDGETITLIDDFEENASVGNGNGTVKNICLDLNGHTFTGSILVLTGSTLTVEDSSENKVGAISGYISNNNGTVIVNGGVISKTNPWTSDRAILNYYGRTLTVYGGTITGGINNHSGTVQLSGGTYDIEPYFGFMVREYCSYDNKDGTWTVKKGTAIRYNSQGEYIKAYSSVFGALDEAETGETVKLRQDATDQYVIVPVGVTLDLAGFKLKANYVVGFNDSNIVDNSNNKTGRIDIDEKNLSLSTDNEELPVYIEGEGYAFIEANLQVRFREISEDSFKLEYRPSVTPLNNKELFGNGAADNGLEFTVTVFWTDASNGLTTCRQFLFSDSLIQKAYSEETTLILTVKGISGLEDLEVAVSVESVNSKVIATVVPEYKQVNE